ncbi:MAG TPA: hypothetical protein VJ952_01095 [Opitutales bacterium]|nr:hypothetical protein [Opitutales bacterium]
MKSIPTLLLCATATVLFGTMTNPAVGQVASYDFGTDPGKTTFSSAGFSANSDTNFTISDETDSVRFNATANNESGGILRTFTALGGGLKDDFSISTQFTLTAFTRDNPGRPGGISLFATSAGVSDINGSGLAVLLRSQDGTDPDLLTLTDGVNDFNLQQTVAWDDVFAQGDTFDMTVEVSFSGADDMLIVATVTRLNGSGGSETLNSGVLSASAYNGGEFFGLAGRYKPGYTTDFNTMTVVPEAGTFALLAGLIALGFLSCRRRV